MRISDWSSDVCSSDLLAAELVAVGDAEENILDPFVGDDGVEHSVERAAFRTVEAKLGRALAREIDDKLRGVRAQCALVEEGRQRLRSGQLIGAGQRSSGQHDIQFGRASGVERGSMYL